jgi:hypothetical protein
LPSDPRIDAYIAKSAPAVRPILEHLRRQIHAAVPGLEETIKWNTPHFTLAGKNVVGFSGFKAHAAIGLHGKGLGETRGTYIKIASLAECPPESELAGLVQAAAQQVAGWQPG